MAGTANEAMRIQPDGVRRAFPALGSDIWSSAGSAPNNPLSRRSGEHIAGANNLRKPKLGARNHEAPKIAMQGEGQSRAAVIAAGSVRGKRRKKANAPSQYKIP